MKNIFKLTTVAALATTLMLGGSCTSNFEEINTDPDALETGAPTNMLGSVLRNTMSQLGGIGDATCTWAGYIVKIQYMDNYNYLPTNNTYGNKFSCCYRQNVQLDDILALTEATAEEMKNIRWAARIWKEYLWLWCTDQFGDIPYTEANQVPENARPVYDDQSIIYPSILANLKVIADEMGQASMTLNELPLSAAAYCYNKNKRNSSGDVVRTEWYLPGIREIEQALLPYYNDFPEFQDKFYWSSAAGEEKDWNIFMGDDEDRTRARATKIRYYPGGASNPDAPDNVNWSDGGEGDYCYIKLCRREASPPNPS